MDPILRTVLLGGASFYPGSSVALDFIRQKYRTTGAILRDPSALPGWTFTRASTGYAETAAGALVNFASGAPRITDKGLLVEESRTNLLLRSQEFDNASWSKSASSVTANAVTAPDGTLTADKLVEDGTTASHYVTQSATTTAVAHSYSVYAKAAERGFMLLWSPTTNFGRVFNISAGTVSGTVAGVTQATADIQSCGNGWYRCTIYVTTTAAANSFRAYTMTDATTFSYAGDGTSGLYLWGAQLEAGSFPTSYIPTTTASATRAADVAYITGLSLPNPNSMVVEWVRNGVTASTFPTLAVQALDADNRFSLFHRESGDQVRISGVTGGVAGGENNTGSVASAVISKSAARVELDGYSGALNGVIGGAKTSFGMPASFVRISIGTSYASSSPLNGYIRRAIIYPYAFTDAQLQAATA